MNVLATTGALVLATLTAVSAHGNIVDPAAVWVQGYPSNGYISEVSNELWGAVDNSKYGYGPEGSVKYFAANFPTSKWKTLGELILANQKMWADSVDKQCGYTILDEAKRTTMPASGEITFSGFTHPGPCELWCDDNKLAFANDCAATYASGKVPFDAAKCSGANKFTIYWIGVQGTPWQVYTNCVYLKGGKAGSSGSSATTTPKTTTAAPATTTTAPKATTATPKATTAAPVASDADATTPAPSSTSAAKTPSPTTKTKCTRRRD
ncbi:hypothetical protein Gpo141_00006855 [Globisporangium polare]